MRGLSFVLCLGLGILGAGASPGWANPWQQAMDRGIQGFEGHRDLPGARAAYSQALELAEKGLDRRRVAESCEMLGRVQLAQNGFDQGLALLERARVEWEGVLDPRTLDLAWKPPVRSWFCWTPEVDATDWERYESVLEGLFQHYLGKRTMDPVLAILDRWIMIRSQRLHPRHRQMGELHAVRGSFAAMNGDLGQARADLQRALEIARVSDYEGTLRKREKELAELPGSASSSELTPILLPEYPARARGPRELHHWIHSSPVKELAFSLDGLRVATQSGALGGAVRVWDVGTGQLLHDFPTGNLIHGGVAFDVQGRLYAAVGFQIRRWDPNGEELPSWDLGAEPCQLEIAPGAELLVVGVFQGDSPSSNGLAVFSLTTGKRLHTLPHSRVSPFTQLEVGPDGEIFVTGGSGGSLSHYPDPRHQESSVLPSGTNFVYDLDLSPQGHLLQRDGQREVRLWNPREKLWKTLPGSLRAERAIFTPDASRVITAGYDWRVRVRKRESGKLLHTLLGHGDVVEGLAVSPDGTRLASGGRDGRVILWNIE